MERWEKNLEDYCSTPAFVQEVVDRCCQLLKGKTDVQPLNIHSEAWEIVSRANEKAQELGISIVVSVVDAAGHVVMTYRMENALLVSSEMSYKKAYTAVGMRMASKDLAPLTQPGQWLYQLEIMSDNKIVSLPGGIPIFEGERLAGGIGVSGGNAREDQLIAEYAVQHLQAGK
ncbi:uncharacterized protein GlcG (DUF336 family) [Streptococcus rupicaprae]|uniref:Uncharacterized protein GlcG (DUF336 family) n=1 Tax=Streptococcus rupicaprae TaxID=759619 RepID=A0ABV2FF52_9STRE